MENAPEILIVDDEFNTREALARYLKRKFTVTTAADGGEAIELLKRRNFDLVLTDLRMPEADGMSVLEAACSKAERPQCIMLTAYGSITDAVKAVKQGAFDFVPKPVKLDKLEEVIRAALAAKQALKQEPAAVATPAGSSGKPAAKVEKIAPAAQGSGIILPAAPSDPMYQVLEKAKLVAPARTTVLLTGESGTGKEVMARWLHNHSGRSGLFVPVHCAALTSTLLESELFGYEKGAFTGAAERRRGRFELADCGTIFLDEIGEIDAATQVKLLRVLETRSFERVGGSETITSDVRLIAATNRNLRKMVEEGSFREDLFYRLSVISLELPPLRERRGEIPQLVQTFVEEFARENQRPVKGVTPEAMEKLTAYAWPGNIRELRNCLESMVVLAQGTELTVEELPENVRFAKETAALARRPEESPMSLDATEREMIAQALEKCHGNRTAAAKLLGISRRTLHRRLAEQSGTAEPDSEA